MHYFDIKGYSRGEGKVLFTTLGRGGDYSRRAIIRGGATIQGNTVRIN